jgi:ankyrin repeat protein
MSDLADLTKAAENGALENVRAILNANPSLVNQKDDSGATALHFAAFNGHRDVVYFLLDRGAQINCTDGKFGATPAGWAIEYLREKGGYLAIELDDFAYAIETGDVRWVKRFLKRFPGLREESSTNGKTFQQLALESGNREIAGLFGVAEAG